jgi:nicotinate-nucleotide adenylyltransferase
VSRRIGIFGGTFDPPHIGHLAVAVEVRHALGLDVVLLVVANLPWQKLNQREITAAAARLDLVRAAVEGLDGVEASDLEIRRGGLSYTADTLETLATEEPDAEWFVILGADAAAGLPTWERGDEVRAQAHVVVAARDGETGPPPEGWTWQTVAVPRLDVSSTDLRARVAAGRPVDVLVPPGVRSRIEALHLYCAAE